MARDFTKKTNRKRNRITKSVILIVAEGRNVTESQYFEQLNKKDNSFRIILAKPGSTTDAEGLWKKAKQYWDTKELSEENGDRAFVVLDLDCDSKKLEIVNRLNGKDNIKFIVSNPSFEIWFLLHYGYTTHCFKDSKEVIRSLKKHIPKYEKTMDVFELLKDKTNIAVNNVNKLKKHYDKLEVECPSIDANPMTDVPKIMEVLKNEH